MSNDWLSDLVCGYLYGDGHHDKTNNRWRLGFTRNDMWASNLRTLAARLGAFVRIRPRFARIENKRYPCYLGEWRTHRSNHPNNKSNNEIIAINRRRARQFWDIEVKDSPH